MDLIEKLKSSIDICPYYNNPCDCENFLYEFLFGFPFSNKLFKNCKKYKEWKSKAQETVTSQL